MGDMQREAEGQDSRFGASAMEVDSPVRRRRGGDENGHGRSAVRSGSDSDGKERRVKKKRGRESDSSSESPARRRGRPRASSVSSSTSSGSSSDSSEDGRSKRRHEKRSKRKEAEKAKEEVLKVERAKVEALVASNAALGGRSGGVYIPPHRMALLRAEAEKKAEQDATVSAEFQKMTWEALRKSINGFVNKVSVHNIKEIVVELLQENVFRGRGLLCKSLMKSQSTSPKFTPVYAALVAIINTKFPDIGVLLLKRLVDQFKKGYRRRDKLSLLAATKFIAHLVNQMVCGVVLPLQILLLLLERPTDDSVEVAVSLMQEIGQRLSEISPQAFNGIFDQFRSILHEGAIDKRVEYLIEGVFAVRRREFEEYPAMPEALDLVEEEDQITHESVSLDDDEDGPIDIEDRLDFFKVDPEYKRHELKYQSLIDEMLGDEGDDDNSDSSLDSDEDPELATKTVAIEDATHNDITILKRAIYLTIMSSRDHEEVVHKLLKMKIKDGDQEHICRMIVQCCSQERTYLKFYGLIAQRLCNVDREYQHWCEKLFTENYETIHRYDNNMLRNVARIFAHLFFTDAIPWTSFKCVKLTERDTTASSRIFIKIMFGDIVEHLGLPRLIKRVQHPTLLHPWLEGMFPTNSPKDTKFAINYWTAIELGALTDQLRLAYTDMIHRIAAKRAEEADRRANEGSESDSSSGYSSSGSSSSSSYSSSSSGSYSSSSYSSSSSSSGRKKSRKSRRH